MTITFNKSMNWEFGNSFEKDFLMLGFFIIERILRRI